MAWAGMDSEMVNMTRVETYYKTEYDVATVANHGDLESSGIDWNKSVKNMMAIVWSRKNKAISSTDGPLTFGTYDSDYFVNNTDASTRTALANHIDSNRSSIMNYDASNDYHVKLIDIIVREMKAL